MSPQMKEPRPFGQGNREPCRKLHPAAPPPPARLPGARQRAWWQSAIDRPPVCRPCAAPPPGNNPARPLPAHARLGAGSPRPLWSGPPSPGCARKMRPPGAGVGGHHPDVGIISNLSTSSSSFSRRPPLSQPPVTQIAQPGQLFQHSPQGGVASTSSGAARRRSPSRIPPVGLSARILKLCCTSTDGKKP